MQIDKEPSDFYRQLSDMAPAVADMWRYLCWSPRLAPAYAHAYNASRQGGYALKVQRPGVKRRIFISFDHDDTDQVNGFLGLRNIMDGFEFYNHKLDREVQSDSSQYVMRVIREKYISPSSVTVVLIGDQTSNSAWVKWEIQESLRQKKGLLGIKLKDSIGVNPEGIPDENVGVWNPDKFESWIEWAYRNREQ